MTKDQAKCDARLVAAFTVLGARGIACDRIAVDERAVPYLDRKEVGLSDRVRITLLTMILLDCIGHKDREPNVLVRAEQNRAYRTDMRWLRKHLGAGGIMQPLQEFLALRGLAL
ncbi:hypothetical protein U879_17565 [Defluviimonas sp. 20V17]|uniref:Uncharacterized protein n=1 Tax=Allgaiera indica TaxID=765699 RepID=A0AAN4USD8_9RHOB|nr:hypothetical protein [Allgaiera indica]KDB02395.1 hypothetical protein U879_17565 [Defluviimonas sp. 20V17]GHE02182.1 hypothetical protein GCM10008024_20770 [Allgaiera indica]SDX06253.1 hypothetical protein SAMN05444006_109131 [Allgaiera indica]